MTRDVASSLLATAFLDCLRARGRAALLVSLVALAASTSASAASSIPLHPDTEIVPSAKGVATEIGAFSGKWVGIWDDTLEHVLVIAQINPSDATAQPAISKLPARLNGRYRFTSSVDFNQYSQTTELEIATQDDGGNITGFFTVALPRWGTSPEAMCYGANRLPMTGRYDGKRIDLSIKGSQNGPGCQDFKRMFLRGKDHYFERKANDDSWYYYYDAAE